MGRNRSEEGHGRVGYLLTGGRFRTTLKTLSKISSRTASARGGGPPTYGSGDERLVSAAVVFVAELCFFKIAAEKPEAQTWGEMKDQRGGDRMGRLSSG